MSTTTQKTIEVASGADDKAIAKQTLFKVGWSYDVYLRKNQFAPSDARYDEFLAISREMSKAHCNEVMELVKAGAKCKGKKRAIFNAKDSRYDTVLTVAVVQPGCTDTEMIIESLVASRNRFAKSLANMEAAAAHQGAI